MGQAVLLYNLQPWKVKDSHKVRGQLLHGTDSVTVQPPALKGQRLNKILSVVKIQKKYDDPSKGQFGLQYNLRPWKFKHENRKLEPRKA